MCAEGIFTQHGTLQSAHMDITLQAPVPIEPHGSGHLSEIGLFEFSPVGSKAEEIRVFGLGFRVCLCSMQANQAIGSFGLPLFLARAQCWHKAP